MLQYQDDGANKSGKSTLDAAAPPPPKPPMKRQRRNNRNKNSRNPRGMNQRMGTTGHGFSGLRDRVTQDSGDHPGSSSSMPRERRHRWRNSNNRPSSDLRENNQASSARAKTHHRANPMPKVATSEWILVTNVPPMSELSDLCESLNQILDYEVQKGIIDLDSLVDLNNSFSCDDKTLDALKRVGALNNNDKSVGSLYSTQPIIDDDIIPLWTAPPPPPSSDDVDSSPPLDNNKMVCPMILEARVHLSYRARPMGWFLRLPNRSVIHAVLSHIRRAEGERQRASHLDKEGDESIKRERREWREGFWKGVWSDYERESKEGETRALLEGEDRDEKELMWGNGLGEEVGEEEEEDYSASDNPAEDAIEEIGAIDPDEQHDEADDYLQNYLESNPYPIQPPKPSVTKKYQYQLLKSGSTVINVQEFCPYPSGFSLPDGVHPPWDQHSFHLGPQQNLSDSVVRVETSILKSTVEDIKYLFRGHDLDAVLPVSEEEDRNSTSIPSSFANFPKSLGWNIDSKRSNVDYLVEGTHARGHSRYARFSNDGKDAAVVRAKKHAFLVRFATPADARMAVRDKEGSRYHFERLSVAQYPRQWE